MINLPAHLSYICLNSKLQLTGLNEDTERRVVSEEVELRGLGKNFVIDCSGKRRNELKELIEKVEKGPREARYY